MSKDIWHTSNEKPEQLRYYLEEYDKFSDGIGYLVNKRYGVGDTIDDLTTKRWCYVDDLLALETENKDLSDKIGKLETELHRTRKALDYCINELDTIRQKDLRTAVTYPKKISEYCTHVIDHAREIQKGKKQ